MELIQAQIAEIKNLKAIYVYATDSVFDGNTEKYVGIKVAYGNDKLFELDYRSEYFQELIKRVLDRYNKEKTKRNIILLGDLSKKLVEDSFFTVLKEDKKQIKQNNRLALFNTSNQKLKSYEKYLKKVLTTILKVEKNYEVLDITSINGYNNKFIVNYNIANIKKSINILIFIDYDLNFKISNIDGKLVNIYGNIREKQNTIDVNWNDTLNDLNGYIKYDIDNNQLEEKVENSMHTLFVDETTDTVLEEDLDILDFYLDIAGLKKLKNVLKLDEDSFLLYDEESLIEGEDSIFYTSNSYKLNIFKDQVIIKSATKNGISKYKADMNVTLDQESTVITLKKLVDKYLLLERAYAYNDEINYSYEVLKVKKNLNFKNKFNYKRIPIEQNIEYLDDVKKLIKTFEGGNN